ncbi:hypothetical protein BD414DRAFT_257159 [Trametes punicea]|nr:hypothetical protein BD414DRAFT_257159 [Trametes punicea]
MSTAHLSLDDFAFPPHPPRSSYELSHALGASQASSIYPHGHLEISPLSAQAPRHHHVSTSDASNSLYLPEHPEAYLNPYSTGMGYSYLDSHLPSYSMTHPPASPHSMYTADSAWGAPDNYGAPYDPAGPSSSSFLHNLQNVIDSSHTSQLQHSMNAAQAAAQQSSTPSTSWTLSGSLDPTTGIFQRSVEHPRLRTAQACEKCRIRKAKCSGDHPACQRCISRGLQCEYAPERKMRGPNKNKRKSISQKSSDKSSEDDRRSSVASIASTFSSSSDVSTPEPQDGAASGIANSASRPSSRADPCPGSSQSKMSADGSRSRFTTVSVAALQRAAEQAALATSVNEQHSSGPPGRQRPPPLNFHDARQFHSNVPAHGTINQPAYGSDGALDAHHTPLPQYLVEAYSRIVQANPQTASELTFHEPPAFVTLADSSASAESSDMARSHLVPYAHDMNAYLQSSPADAMSIYSHPRSNSSDVSAPVTPLSLSSDGRHDNTHELAYPDYSVFDAAAHAHATEHSFADMEALGGTEDTFTSKGCLGPVHGGQQWDVSMADDDETPRADKDRKLSSVGQLMAEAQVNPSLS